MLDGNEGGVGLCIVNAGGRYILSGEDDSALRG